MSHIRQRPNPPRQKDHREQLVQINVPVPRWYREQVYDYCDETGKSYASVVIGALLLKVPPRKPPKLTEWPPKHYKWGYVPPTEEIDEAAEG
jgi:hypothetical protein